MDGPQLLGNVHILQVDYVLPGNRKCPPQICSFMWHYTHSTNSNNITIDIYQEIYRNPSNWIYITYPPQPHFCPHDFSVSLPFSHQSDLQIMANPSDLTQHLRTSWYLVPRIQIILWYARVHTYYWTRWFQTMHLQLLLLLLLLLLYNCFQYYYKFCCVVKQSL